MCVESCYQCLSGVIIKLILSGDTVIAADVHPQWRITRERVVVDAKSLRFHIKTAWRLTAIGILTLQMRYTTWENLRTLNTMTTDFSAGNFVYNK